MDEDAFTCAVCSNPYTSCPYDLRLREPRVLRCGHTFCAHCIRELQRRAENGRIECPNRCEETTPVDPGESGVKNYTLLKAVADKEQDDQHRVTVLRKCASGACSLSLLEVAMVVEMGHLDQEIDAEAGLSSMRRQLHTLMTSLIAGSMLTRLQGLLICRWIPTHRPLRLLSRVTRDGPSHADLLRCVGNAKPLVFVVKRDIYMFGVFASAAIRPPDNPAAVNEYGCAMWEFSLAGHFDTPTLMDDIDPEFGRLEVAGGQNAPMLRVDGLTFGVDGQDVSSCNHSCGRIVGYDMPDGYRGKADGDNNALLAGSDQLESPHGEFFTADDLEVLTVG
ncbi:unnamed protein product [Vitrella brassicaformis CCMP3155]|uniref:RING-type domain-containing protein n=2 Tax=Vitrella brassicaformis TaxID=1169539 RepID=A0A0G4GM53_VITBC|nr:unnamed protein product [Vitrella brassicaformis CCMP3155]|eukprot:CEM31270.1 unnamed protein product [Vitrella brassicaformis CCMP3155]